MTYEPKITCHYANQSYSETTKGWHIELDGERVHFAKTDYERDMFIAELKARIKILRSGQEDGIKPEKSTGGFLVPEVVEVDESSPLRKLFIKLGLAKPKIRKRNILEELKKLSKVYMVIR